MRLSRPRYPVWRVGGWLSHRTPRPQQASNFTPASVPPATAPLVPLPPATVPCLRTARHCTARLRTTRPSVHWQKEKQLRLSTSTHPIVLTPPDVGFDDRLYLVCVWDFAYSIACSYLDCASIFEM